VRANSIFRKLGTEATEQALMTVGDEGLSEKVGAALSGESGTEIWSLVVLAERLDEVIRQVSISAEPANLAKYTFNLAKSFNLFYHRHRIIAEEDPAKKAVLITAANIARNRLTKALSILGISVPAQM
jgi:arginyl-tRNA synthetase